MSNKETVEMYQETSVRVLALSGGVDSMYLYKKLKTVYSKKKENLVIAHVNHNLREESKEEYSYLEQMVQDDGYVFYGTTLDVPAYCHAQKVSIEEGARDLRYLFFQNVMEEVQATGIYFAHHGDDLVETMLMRLVAGVGRKGLIAMRPTVKRAGYWYLRPLLSMSKQEIYTAMENEIYFEDKSNESSLYKRNRYRKLLPELKKENPQVHKAFMRVSEDMNESEQYWTERYQEVQHSLGTWASLDSQNQSSLYYRLDIEKFVSYPQYEQKQYMRNVLRELGLSTLSTTNMEELLDIIRNGRPFKTDRAFLRGFRLMRYENHLEIRKPCYNELKKLQEHDRLKEGYRLVTKPKEIRINGKRLNKYVIENQPFVDKRSPVFEKEGVYVYLDGTPVQSFLSNH